MIIPNDNVILKNNIKPLSLQKQTSTSNTPNNFHYKNKPTTDTQFNTLLKEHLFELQKLKKYPYKQPKNISQRYLPNNPPFTIPTPKNTNTKITTRTFKPTLGRPRLSPYAYSNITKKYCSKRTISATCCRQFFYN